MILPIYAYGQSVLKRVADDIDPDYPDLAQLIDDMWETMYHAQGVGLAAPQVGLPIRLFVVDTQQMMEEGKEEEGFKQVFINARKIEEAGKPWTYEEGCLSIPDVRGEVERKPQIKLRYLDADFSEHIRIFDGIHARVIQHEYDHIDGVLFIDHLKPLKKRLINRKLDNIKKGKIDSDYRMKFSRR